MSHGTSIVPARKVERGNQVRILGVRGKQPNRVLGLLVAQLLCNLIRGIHDLFL